MRDPWENAMSQSVRTPGAIAIRAVAAAALFASKPKGDETRSGGDAAAPPKKKGGDLKADADVPPRPKR